MNKQEILREITRLNLDLEECQEALEIVHKDIENICNKKNDLNEELLKLEYKQVSEQIKSDERSSDLGWSHHLEVASLEPEKQKELHKKEEDGKS